MKFDDYSMSPISFLNTEMGNLPNSSYILCNMELLETEFTTVDFSTGEFL